MSSTKKNNARIEKWRQMLSTGLYNDQELLTSRIRKGIPPAIRILAWPEMVHLDKFIESQLGNGRAGQIPINSQSKSKNQFKIAQGDAAKTSYTSLINSFSNSVYEISLDIPRTFPQEEDSKVLRKSMNNVLKAISIVYTKVGYCQGMNFLIMRILQVLGDEEAFWLIRYLFDNDPSLMKNYEDPKQMDKQNHIFIKLLEAHLPKVYSTFSDQNVFVQAYTIKWFISLYSSVVSQELFYRIFQCYLHQGWSVIYAVAIALLRGKQEIILSNTFESNLYLLNSGIYSVGNIDAFMEAVFKQGITQKQINTLAMQYDNRDSALRDSYKESQKKRIEEVANREKINKNLQIRRPQSQDLPPLQVQCKGQELMFDSFKLI